MLGVADELHGRVVHVHVRQLHIGELLSPDGSHTLAPQLGHLQPGGACTGQAGHRSVTSQSQVSHNWDTCTQGQGMRDMLGLVFSHKSLTSQSQVQVSHKSVAGQPPLQRPAPSHLEDIGLVDRTQALRPLPGSLKAHARNPVDLHMTA